MLQVQLICYSLDRGTATIVYVLLLSAKLLVLNFVRDWRIIKLIFCWCCKIGRKAVIDL